MENSRCSNQTRLKQKFPEVLKGSATLFTSIPCATVALYKRIRKLEDLTCGSQLSVEHLSLNSIPLSHLVIWQIQSLQGSLDFRTSPHQVNHEPCSSSDTRTPGHLRLFHSGQYSALTKAYSSNPQHTSYQNNSRNSFLCNSYNSTNFPLRTPNPRIPFLSQHSPYSTLTFQPFPSREYPTLPCPDVPCISFVGVIDYFNNRTHILICYNCIFVLCCKLRIYLFIILYFVYLVLVRLFTSMHELI